MNIIPFKRREKTTRRNVPDEKTLIELGLSGFVNLVEFENVNDGNHMLFAFLQVMTADSFIYHLYLVFLFTSSVSLI